MKQKYMYIVLVNNLEDRVNKCVGFNKSGDLLYAVDGMKTSLFSFLTQVKCRYVPGKSYLTLFFL